MRLFGHDHCSCHTHGRKLNCSNVGRHDCINQTRNRHGWCVACRAVPSLREEKLTDESLCV